MIRRLASFGFTVALLTLGLTLAAARPVAAAPAKVEAPAEEGTLGTRVYVVERASESLALYDYAQRKLVKKRIEGLGDLRHATMTFSPDLRWGFLATRAGKVSRIDLQTGQKSGEVQTSNNSIDNAISHDGRTIATAEYVPGGVTFVDAATMKLVKRHDAKVVRDGKSFDSRVTGMVDAPGNRFVCVLMEGAEIWIIDASKPDFPITHRIPTGEGIPYDAMITADGRYYVVGKLDSPRIAVLDLSKPEAGVRDVSLEDEKAKAVRTAPVKLPHMASWAQAGSYVFVPLVGEKRLAVLDRDSFAFKGSVPLRGNPVYAVRAPSEREVWVSFSGEADDAYVQVIDTRTLAVTRELLIGKRIYHMDFTPRGSHVLISANADDKLVLVDALRYEIVDTQTLRSPSGIFGPWRAFRVGL